MLSAFSNIRNRMVISTLYDPGYRVLEILTLIVKDLEFDEFDIRLTVKGKTVVRRLRAVEDPVPTLRKYLGSHKGKISSDFVFVQLTGTKDGEPMKWSQGNSMLINILRGAKIEKRIHAHLFRLTRATILVRDMKVASLENVMGGHMGPRWLMCNCT
jgi:integrase